MPDSRSMMRRDDFSNPHFPFIGNSFWNRDLFFPDFFDKDPFDDPFFTRPFGSLFPSSEDIFEPLHQRHAARIAGRQRHQQNGSRGPVIEELPGDYEESIAAVSKSNQEPIVEHPDDIASSHGYKDEFKNVKSFSFSSIKYGGPQGTYYQSSTIRRAGANGLFEEVHEEKDSINGLETNKILHGLGNKGHAVTRKKRATGVEDYVETLHNLTEEEKVEFDETWRKQAKKYLPGHSKSRGMTLKNIHSEQEVQREQVPSKKPTKQLTWRWPFAKKA